MIRLTKFMIFCFLKKIYFLMSIMRENLELLAGKFSKESQENKHHPALQVVLCPLAG